MWRDLGEEIRSVLIKPKLASLVLNTVSKPDRRFFISAIDGRDAINGKDKKPPFIIERRGEVKLKT